MHIPDGFLDAKTWVSATAISTGVLGYSIAKTREQISDRQVPQLGVMAAFIFAAQMINFPIAGGTSGHLLGAALATALLGPWSASIVLATVLMIQCFVFQDGGLTALGANILNMGVVGVLVAAGIYGPLSRLIKGKTGVALASFAASWASVMAAAFMTSAELALSGIPFAVVLPAMLGVHALIGIGEGVITAAVVLAVLNAGFSPNWLRKGDVCSE
ncbi:MAG: energy-coupling factor ABC transporter permease [Bacillota bacterium]|nr:energy-coupling factor ABC transporter permease [Bacillota bacterium]